MEHDRNIGRDALFRDLSEAFHGAMAGLVPRFLESMPPAYFHDTDHTTRVAHLKALIAAEASGMPQDLTLRSADNGRVTFIRDASYPGLLAELVRRLPRYPPLSSAKVHTATDGCLVLDTFELGEPEVCDLRNEEQAKLVADKFRLLAHQHDLEAGALRQHLGGCARDYLQRMPTRHMAAHYRLLERMHESGLCEISMVPQDEEGVFRASLACPSREGQDLFARIATYLGQRQVDITRGHVDLFYKDNAEAAIITVLIRVPGGAEPDDLAQDLVRLRYLDDAVLSLWQQSGDLSLLESEVLVALGRLAHQRLSPQNPLAFTRDRIQATLSAHPRSAASIARRLLDRLAGTQAPAMPVPDFNDVRDSFTARILEALAELSDQVLRSNAWIPQRRAIALRLPGEALPAPGAVHTRKGTARSDPSSDQGELPFGVFFIHGRDFDGVHVRFRDIARGGVRIVRPRGPEQFTLESERLYQEGFQLAWAQHLKNKDIPEGGAKGVILITPGSAPGSAARAYADALLDLIAPDPRTRSRVGLESGAGEVLYLGPDENISDEMINWIANRARQRHYPLPSAFISSKPETGINHKEYGVTSEGVTVFLDAALRSLGLDPDTETFTVKLTGGPDGDVAGNEIRILHRRYGSRARILGIADGSGCAEDPQGLDYAELLRLVDTDAAIADFDVTRLGPQGRVTPIEEDPGAMLRDNLHNRLLSDAFIPAGGRPATINGENWHRFLDSDGRPSSRLIVEGANLFLTAEARQALSAKGVLIVKDSSANKCGVICSSLEILASMLFSETDFLSIKAVFVNQVLDLLRGLARLEADALFRENRSRPQLALPVLSERLSRAINRVTDLLVARIPAVRAIEPQVPAVLLGQHLPPVLLADPSLASLQALPTPYVDRALASMLGGRIVYREGLCLVEEMEDENLGKLAERYLLQEYRTLRLAQAVAASDLPERALIVRLFQEGATAAALRLNLDDSSLY